MFLNKRGVRLALALTILAALACRTADVFVAQVTVTPTRTPRPTFTPLPKLTDTPIPLPTNTLPPPPPTLAPTRTPTRVPTRVPTKVPTAVPPPVVVQTTAVPTQAPPQMAFGQETRECVHAGNQYIKGRVYDSRNSDANGLGGQMLALGGADGSNPWVTVRNEDDGFYTFTLAGVGQPAGPGTYYVWMYDSGSGRRISDIGGPIKMNPVGPDVPGACWNGSVDFWKR